MNNLRDILSPYSIRIEFITDAERQQMETSATKLGDHEKKHFIWGVLIQFVYIAGSLLFYLFQKTDLFPERISFVCFLIAQGVVCAAITWNRWQLSRHHRDSFEEAVNIQKWLLICHAVPSFILAFAASKVSLENVKTNWEMAAGMVTFVLIVNILILIEFYLINKNGKKIVQTFKKDAREGVLGTGQLFSQIFQVQQTGSNRRLGVGVAVSKTSRLFRYLTTR